MGHIQKKTKDRDNKSVNTEKKQKEEPYIHKINSQKNAISHSRCKCAFECNRIGP